MLSFLYVVGRHSLVLTDLRQKGACNQREEDFGCIFRQFTRRHSFCSYWRSPAKKEQGYTEGTVILVRETLKPPKKRKHVVMCT